MYSLESWEATTLLNLELGVSPILCEAARFFSKVRGANFVDRPFWVVFCGHWRADLNLWKDHHRTEGTYEKRSQKRFLELDSQSTVLLLQRRKKKRKLGPLERGLQLFNYWRLSWALFKGFIITLKVSEREMVTTPWHHFGLVSQLDHSSWIKTTFKTDLNGIAIGYTRCLLCIHNSYYLLVAIEQ